MSFEAAILTLEMDNLPGWLRQKGMKQAMYGSDVAKAAAIVQLFVGEGFLGLYSIQHKIFMG